MTPPVLPVTATVLPKKTMLPNEVYRRYRFDSAGGKLTLQIYYAGNAAGPVYTLASNISAATFGPPRLTFFARPAANSFSPTS